ncbi:MAG: bifunctional UDP-sugar hydrolase/5'-nucleotidase [Anaerolineaceae bacterium]
MHRKNISSALVIVLMIILLIGVFTPASAQAPTTIDLQILALNDFHGQLDPYSATRGGAEYLATLVKQKRAETEHTLFVSAGDLIGASPLLSALFHDEPTINAFNLMGLDYAIPGNHEFDEGVAELKRMQEGGCNPVDGCLAGDFFGSEFKWLAGNVIRLQNGNTLFSAYKVRTLADVRVGIVGIAADFTPSIVTPAGTEGVEFLNEEEALNSIVAELKADGVKTIVVIIHDGGFQTGSINSCTNFSGDLTDVIWNADPEIDLFISGHTHNAYNCVIDDRVVTAAGNGGQFLTDIDLVLDRETGNIVSKTVTNLEVLKAQLTKDPDMTALLSPYRILAAPLTNKVIGSITADIIRGGNMAESPLGDVIADAQLAATSAPDKGGAVVAFMNPGGIRANFLFNQISGSEQPGEITYGEAFTVQPFYNIMMTTTMTGADIKAVLEQQAVAGSDKKGRILQISDGLTYTYTLSAPVGSKVSNIQINGVDLDMFTSYRVSMNNFLAGGGDGFTVFKNGTDPLVGVTDIDALVAHFQVNSPVAPGPANRITFLP